MTQEETKWLNNLLNVEDGLTEWEMEFIDSLYRQRMEQLSEKQHKILKRIYDEKGL